jgi:GTP-binding protein
LIDAQEGPMPQTRFVTKKALALGLKPIVVVNKVDKPGAKPDAVINAAFDLFDKLGASDEQLDFPVVYASGINGWTSLTEGAPGEQWGPDMSALFNTILKHVPPNSGDPEAPLQLQISALDFSTFVGRIGVGRISQGTIKPSMDVLVMEGPDGKACQRPRQPRADLPGPGPRASHRSRPGRHRADQRHRRHRHRRDGHRPRPTPCRCPC